MFDIELYSNSSDERVVDKTITLLNTIQGELVEQSGILNPSVRIEFDGIPNFNYAKIPAFGNRYYFVAGEPVNLSYNMWQINFHHDVLMNLKNQFREIEGIIGRQEFLANHYLVDSNTPIETNSQFYISSGQNWDGGKTFTNKYNVVLISSAAIKSIGGTNE